MNNLLLNSIDAISDKKTKSGGQIRIGLSASDDGCTITFGDNGNGIQLDIIDQIFEPFFSTKGPGRGTGLGLFVSRSIVTELNGRVMLDQESPEGTSFYVSFPSVHGAKQ